MQKKILVAVIGSVLASPAVFADSANVTISGRLAAGVESYKLGGDATASGATATLKDELRVSDQSSNLVFSGSEDLGGGLKAWFQIDTRPALDLGTFTAAGNTQVGLQGGFGKLALGRADLHYQETNVLGGWGASSSLQSWLTPGPVSQVEGIGIANTTRTPNVIMWDSPNFGGITARLAVSTNAGLGAPAGNEGSGVNDGSKGLSTNAVLRWSGGPLLLGVSLWKQQAEGPADSAALATAGTPAAAQNCLTTTLTNISKAACLGSAGDQKSTKAWVGYSLPMGLKVGFVYDTSEVTAATATKAKRTAYAIPVSFSFGADSLHFQYATMGKTNVTGVGDVADTGAKAYAIGYDHAVSKRTFVGATYTKLDNKPNSSYDLFAIGANGATPTSVQGGQDVTQIYVGIAHFY